MIPYYLGAATITAGTGCVFAGQSTVGLLLLATGAFVLAIATGRDRDMCPGCGRPA